MSSISTTSDFVSELVRAVNQIHVLTPNERKELVARGIASIRELRLTLDESGADTPMTSRTLSEVETLIAEMDDTPNELVAAAFVVLCDEINKLLKICETASATEEREQ
ncbi:hypothetical protein J2W42_002263 [Rhizobium tibeticum]|uniref:Uncharacterized protein n=1 Tax=Rhizobium tibeticum TaxID=501024 RepID=A0A1H8M5I8_9HYPH|nr:hypothetical protein [Rhizobium tibeticum]MDP9809415.1 hypothetical protein [Rhizobium tibeticum]SEH94024.1 hypothetical protein RTCCBAU85039_3217 [Rhizobium tibeticum]SEO12642.1 hypothetical protein SAMN05216228_101226 [Rhizobium tibeticum]